MIQASVLLAVAGRVHGTAQPRVHILPISWWRTFRVRHTGPKVRDSWLWTHNVIQRQELQCGYPFVSMHCLQALPLSSCTVHPLRIPACRTPGKGEAVMWRISCRPSGSATKPFRIFVRKPVSQWKKLASCESCESYCRIHCHSSGKYPVMQRVLGGSRMKYTITIYHEYWHRLTTYSYCYLQHLLREVTPMILPEQVL